MNSFLNRKLLFVVLGVVVALVAVVTLNRRPETISRPTYMVGVPERGAKLFYGDKQCGICHSVNGSGGRIAPDLTSTSPEKPALGWLAAKVWNHGPAMWRHIRRYNKPFPELNPQEMADILSFLYRASNADPAGNSADGRQVFTDKGCARCHSVGTEGGKTAPELSKTASGGDHAEWTRAMLNHAGSMVEPITRTLGQWPQFSGHEMNDLIAYANPVRLNSDKQTRSAPGDVDHGLKVFQDRCAQCHSIAGKGAKVGPDLGPEHDLPLSTARFTSLMWNHAPAMLQKGRETNVPPPQLLGTEMNDLLAFLASLRYVEPAGTPVVGKQVFADRGCAACHGNTAEGTQSGPRLKADKNPFTAVSFASALWRHGPRMIDRAQEMGMPWPELQATDIGNLVSFLNEPVQTK